METEIYDEVDPQKLNEKPFPLETYFLGRLLYKGFTTACDNGFNLCMTAKQLERHLSKIKKHYV